MTSEEIKRTVSMVELVEKYGVMQAPTLVVVENNRAKKYVNASNIKKYVETK